MYIYLGKLNLRGWVEECVISMKLFTDQIHFNLIILVIMVQLLKKVTLLPSLSSIAKLS